MLVRELPYDEEAQEHHSGQAQYDDLARAEPAMVVALVQHDLQGGDADDQKDETKGIDGSFGGRRFPLAQQHPGRPGGEQSHRHIDEEDP